MNPYRENAVGRVVCRFSCGAASAVATKLAIEQFGDRVHIINAFVADELDDNRRFLADCEKWLGREILVVRDTQYGACAETVWNKRRFIAGLGGAPCSKILKRDVMQKYDLPSDTMVLGYTADKKDAKRLDDFIDANPDVKVIAPLIDAGITKQDCFDIIKRAGIELPLMYRLGYNNANCPGCPKGGMGYWNKIRVDFPERFERMAALQDELGPGSYFFRDRKKGPGYGQRISLRMLDPHRGNFESEPSFECGAVCEWPDPVLDDEEAA